MKHIESIEKDLIPVRTDADKKRYIISWLVLLAGLFAYAIYLAIKVADSYENPGAQIGASTNPPPWPAIAICFVDPITRPTFYVVWNPSQNSAPIYFEPEDIEFMNISTGRGASGFDTCIQFNHKGHQKIKQHGGYLELSARTSYEKTAERSIARILLLPQEESPFETWQDPESYDELILPSSTLVVAQWTVHQRVDVDGDVTTYYQLKQQIEDLTDKGKQSVFQQTPDQSGDTFCTEADEPCSYQGFDGVCQGNTCAYTCQQSTDLHIPIWWRCDSILDCPGGDDESDCNIFNCTDGSIITSSQVCNGIRDCPSGVDEATCENLPIILAARVGPYNKQVQITREVVTFGWEAFFAALSSAWAVVTVAIAFLFPEEVNKVLKWRLRKDY